MVKMPDILNSNESDVKRIIKGTCISVLITLISLIVFSILLTYSNISEKVIPTVIIIISMVSILIGSTISMSKQKKNGIINGLIIGIMYIGIIYLLSSLIKGSFILNQKSLIMMLCVVISGAVGGIIGVNKK